MEILQNYTRFTPDFITSLFPNQVFVFGTDVKGSQRYGAAGIAHRFFGAQRGVSNGPTGNAYAIATKDESYENLYDAIQRFIDYAKKQSNITFFVTPIGCGHAGFGVELIAPIFVSALTLKNVYLPKQFIAFYNSHQELLSTQTNTDIRNKYHSDNSSKIDFIFNALSDSNIAYNKNGNFTIKDCNDEVVAEAEICIERLRIIANPINSISRQYFLNTGYTVVTLDDLIEIIHEVKQ